MKLKSGFILHTVGGEHVVVPVGARTKDFRGMIRLNETGAFLWSLMQNEFTKESAAAALQEEYEITSEVANTAVDNFLATLREADLLESAE